MVGDASLTGHRILAVRARVYLRVTVLEAAYEATLWAAALNTHRTAVNVVYLTRVGGGAFGNETAWIDGAIRRALTMVAGVGLDVRLVSYGQPDQELLRLVGEFR